MTTKRMIDRFIGRKIYAIRHREGVTDWMCAEYLGISHSEYILYERGERRISASHLYLLAQLFHTPIGEFFNGLTESNNNG